MTMIGNPNAATHRLSLTKTVNNNVLTVSCQVDMVNVEDHARKLMSALEALATKVPPAQIEEIGITVGFGP